MSKRGLDWPIKIVLILGIAALLVSIVLPTLNRMRHTSGRVPCASNLRQIGQALLLYQMDHDGMWPTRLDELVTNKSITLEVLQCAETHKPSIFNRPNAIAKNVAADDVVAYEPLDYHDGEGSNVLYGDGHVNWLTPEELKRALGNPATQPSTVTSRPTDVPDR